MVVPTNELQDLYTRNEALLLLSIKIRIAADATNWTAIVVRDAADRLAAVYQQLEKAYDMSKGILDEIVHENAERARQIQRGKP